MCALTMTSVIAILAYAGRHTESARAGGATAGLAEGAGAAGEPAARDGPGALVSGAGAADDEGDSRDRPTARRGRVRPAVRRGREPVRPRLPRRGRGRARHPGEERGPGRPRHGGDREVLLQRPRPRLARREPGPVRGLPGPRPRPLRASAVAPDAHGRPGERARVGG